MSTEQAIPIVPTEFLAENVSFTEPKRKVYEGKSTIRCYMLYNNSMQFYETPWLRTPFNISAFAGNNDSGKFASIFSECY